MTAQVRKENTLSMQLGRSPSELTGAELAAFKDLVLLSDEVEKNGLDERIASARLLATVSVGSRLAAVGAIKQAEAHRLTVMKASGFDLPDTCRHELGWVSVLPDVRGMGLGSFVTKFLVRESAEPLWATTRVANTTMHSILNECGFLKEGRAFKSTRGYYDLLLWVLLDRAQVK